MNAWKKITRVFKKEHRNQEIEETRTPKAGIVILSDEKAKAKSLAKLLTTSLDDVPVTILESVEALYHFSSVPNMCYMCDASRNDDMLQAIAEADISEDSHTIILEKKERLKEGSIANAVLANFVTVMGGRWFSHQDAVTVEKIRNALAYPIRMTSVGDMLQFVEKHGESVFIQIQGAKSEKGRASFKAVVCLSEGKPIYAFSSHGRAGQEALEEILSIETELVTAHRLVWHPFTRNLQGSVEGYLSSCLSKKDERKAGYGSPLKHAERVVVVSREEHETKENARELNFGPFRSQQAKKPHHPQTPGVEKRKDALLGFLDEDTVKLIRNFEKTLDGSGDSPPGES